jgi:hypothetical protein
MFASRHVLGLGVSLPPSLSLSDNVNTPQPLTEFEISLTARSTRLRKAREANELSAKYPQTTHDANIREKDLLTTVINAAIPPKAPPLPPPSAFILTRNRLILKATSPFVNAGKLIAELFSGAAVDDNIKKLDNTPRDAALLRDMGKRCQADQAKILAVRAEDEMNSSLVFNAPKDRGSKITLVQKRGGGIPTNVERFTAPGKVCDIWEPVGGFVGNHDPKPLKTTAEVRVLPRELRAERLLIPNTDATRQTYLTWYEAGNGRRLLKRG